MNNNDLVRWAQANGATSEQTNTALVEAYQALGASSSQLNNATQEYYESLGLSGTLPDMDKTYWEDSKEFTIIVGVLNPFAGWSTTLGETLSGDDYLDSSLSFIQVASNIAAIRNSTATQISDLTSIVLTIEGFGVVTLPFLTSVYQAAPVAGLSAFIEALEGEELRMRLNRY